MTYPHDPPGYAPATGPTYAPAAPAYGVAPPPHAPPAAPYAARVPDREPGLAGLKETTLGSLGLFAILGLALSILAFVAAFALAEQAEGGLTEAEAVAATIPVVVVGLLPLLAAPLLALAGGSWSGHVTRDARTGALAGAIAGFVGPILMMLVVGIGFALGAGAANLDLSGVRVAGLAPGWGTTMPAIFSGSGLLYLLACALAGTLGGGLVGGVLEGRWTRRADPARRTRRPMRI